MHRLDCRECEVGDSKLSETLVFIYDYLRIDTSYSSRNSNLACMSSWRSPSEFTGRAHTHAHTHTHTHTHTHPEAKLALKILVLLGREANSCDAICWTAKTFSTHKPSNLPSQDKNSAVWLEDVLMTSFMSYLSLSLEGVQTNQCYWLLSVTELRRFRHVYSMKINVCYVVTSCSFVPALKKNSISYSRLIVVVVRTASR